MVRRLSLRLRVVRRLPLGGGLGWGWRGRFNVGVEPAALFPEHVFEQFFGFVAVRFEGEPDEADGCALAFEGFLEAFAPDREGTLVAVGFAVHEEDGGGDLVGVVEGDILK